MLDEGWLFWCQCCEWNADWMNFNSYWSLMRNLRKAFCVIIYSHLQFSFITSLTILSRQRHEQFLVIAHSHLIYQKSLVQSGGKPNENVFGSLWKPLSLSLSLFSLSLCLSGCNWILPAGLWSGLVLTALVLFVFICWREKRKSYRPGVYTV